MVLQSVLRLVKDLIWIWHLWDGHVNFNGLVLLLKKNIMKDLPSINHPNLVCEGCLLDKPFRKSFPKKSSSKAQKPLKFIYTDVYGLTKPSSLGKSNYFLFIYWWFFKKNLGVFFEVEVKSFSSKRLPNAFLAEVVVCTIYLSNKSSTRSL